MLCFSGLKEETTQSKEDEVSVHLYISQSLWGSGTTEMYMFWLAYKWNIKFSILVSLLYLSSFLHHSGRAWIHLRCTWSCFLSIWFAAHIYIYFLSIIWTTSLPLHSPYIKVPALTTKLLLFLLPAIWGPLSFKEQERVREQKLNKWENGKVRWKEKKL